MSKPIPMRRNGNAHLARFSTRDRDAGLLHQEVCERALKDSHDHGGGEANGDKFGFQVGEERCHDADRVATVRCQDQRKAEISGNAGRIRTFLPRLSSPLALPLNSFAR